MFSEDRTVGAIILAIMRYLFRVERFWSDIEAQISRVLPSYITYRVTDGEARLVLDTLENLSREHAQLLIERECDRIGFLTGRAFRASTNCWRVARLARPVRRSSSSTPSTAALASGNGVRSISPSRAFLR